ncbi:glycosyltransferase family 2 protein [Roseateles terrae]|uniref:Glycosyltransferase involved in cell wall biosynthesis n=1 Tax=Roseateles terrae TaxID=431060 RepID=A0ABR6GQ45_9BURK|nr:glycosyltransferase family 2 protein [Roseateles terrae]MBB3194237.1 glycosyltransferase involved in cell wall biosynthesis [Roseateles terrae]OWQ88082.1 glycosyl transferase [Roseateles terrae]
MTASASLTVGAVIPVYNHAVPVVRVAQALRAHGLPVLLVDDGSEPVCAAALDRLALEDGIELLRLPQNQGKGGAVMAGLTHALGLGWTHALQIDADGQHDTTDVPAFLAQAQQHPDHFICGCPIYDASVPKGRLYGRYATHIWVWINTLSFAVRDSMCGFRIYPLAEVVDLLRRTRVGRRMDFDVEIAVRLVWAGVPVINQPTRVRYPEDGVSHFRVLRDNVLISAMHTRLFFGMLWRAPRLLWRRWAA